MCKYPGTQIDSSGMWFLHHVSVIVAISAQFNFSISETLAIFGTPVLCLYLRPQASPTSKLDLCVIAPGNNWRLGQLYRMKSYNNWYIPLLVGTRTAAQLGGSVECHPCITP